MMRNTGRKLQTLAFSKENLSLLLNDALYILGGLLLLRYHLLLLLGAHFSLTKHNITLTLFRYRDIDRHDHQRRALHSLAFHHRALLARAFVFV